ncbi:MAG: diaminopimelate decarboxylase [Oligoflexia bacterium]
MKKTNQPSAFGYRSGKLYADQVELSSLALRLGTPLYVYSASSFEAGLKALQKGLAPLGRSTVCYALKSNSNVAIVRMMGELGAGADIVSGGELERARLAGIDGKNIVFSGVGKTADEISAGIHYGTNGITSFHVESVPELLLIDEVARSVKKGPARVALRFNPNIDAKTHPYISTGLKRNKFGLNAAEVREAVSLLPSLKGVTLAGMSIHIGSQLTSLSPLKAAFAALGREILAVESTLGRQLDFADLGGGVGIQYKKESPPSIDSYCKEVVKAFGPKSQFGSRLRILLEPGRVISGNSGVLVSKVLFRKKRPGKDFLIIDAGMNDLMRPALYGSYHGLVPLEQARTRSKSKKTDLVGPVCESGDCFASDRPVPVSLQAGDLVACLSAGAYGMSLSRNDNSRPRPAEVLVTGSQWRVIRDRERFEDLIRGEHA